MKKNFFGICLTVLAVILAVVGVVFYVINTRTSYFSNQGLNITVVAAAGGAALGLLIYLIAAGKGPHFLTGLLPVCASVLLVLSTVLLLGARVAGIASIMTFEGNASTRADMTSAIVAIAALLLATIISTIASFHDLVKE